MSDRASEAVRTALLITHDVVQQLADDIRAEGLDALFAVSIKNKLLRQVEYSYCSNQEQRSQIVCVPTQIVCVPNRTNHNSIWNGLAFTKPAICSSA